MSILSRAAQPFIAAYKAAATIIFGNRTGGSWWGNSLLGRTNTNYAAMVGDGRGNAIVVACLEAFTTAFSEAPIRVQRVTGKTLTPVPDHPMIQLLQRPNPYYSGVLLMKAFVSDWLLGNAYMLKVRSRIGGVVQLYWIPAGMLEPRWDDRNGEYIGWYEYTVDGQKVRYETADVVHLRNGFDPNNMRKGLSRLAALIREIATDDEAANFSASLLRNLGVPGVILAPQDKDDEIPEDVAEVVKMQMGQAFGGDNRGNAMVMTRPTSISILSFSPEQMNLQSLRRIPEERISAAIGVPAIVAGLGAGLDRSTYSNMEEAREMFYETSIVPSYRLFAAELHSQLMTDFEADLGRVVVDFDISKVRVLQADEDALHTRIREDVRAGLITINMGLEKLGWDKLPGGDVLLLPINVMPVLPADLETMAQAAPEPAPAAVAPAALPMPPKALSNGVHA